PRASAALFPYTTLFRSVDAVVGVLDRGHARPEIEPSEGEAVGVGSGGRRIGGFGTGLYADVSGAQAGLDEIDAGLGLGRLDLGGDRKSTRLNSSHVKIS